jgi:hypothetical protein
MRWIWHGRHPTDRLLAQASRGNNSTSGSAKFESEPLWWMPAGLTRCGLNGLFFGCAPITQSTVTLTGGSNPWYGLVLAAVWPAGQPRYWPG